MPKNAPTYLLGPDFDAKLERFARKAFADGLEEFAAEFARLDDYIARAHQADNTESLRRTPKEKYLLELLAFWTYDRFNREAFNAARRTLIILPDCLSLHNPDCLRTDEPWGDRCLECTPDCQAAEVMELASEYDLPVYFSKRKLTQQLEHYAGHADDLSVIGIACIMMLAEGMRSAHDVGIPARGVLLSFSGCEHWNDQPCASEFPMAQLRAILEEKYGPRD